MRISNAYKFLTVLTLLLLVNSTPAAPSTNWGVDAGDTAVFWLDQVKVDDANLASVFTDANRTTIVGITSIGESHLNYSLGLQNGTELVNNQQVKIDQTTIDDTTIYYPNGSFPFVLPISVNGYSNYLDNLAGNTNLISLVINEFIKGQNLSSVETFDINGIYRSTFLNITANIELNELTNISSTLLPQINMTDQIGFGENQTIKEADFSLNIAYNSTDGMLMTIDLDSSMNTTVYQDGTETNQSRTFNTTIIRKSFTPISDIDRDQISQAADNSFLMLGIVPAILLIRKFRN